MLVSVSSTVLATLSLIYYTHTHTHTHTHTCILYIPAEKKPFSVCVRGTLKPLSHKNPCHTNTNLFADCWATRIKSVRNADLTGSSCVCHAFAWHSLSRLWTWQRPTKMSMSHICRATCKTPKNLDVVGVHVVGIRQCSAFALHLACIRSRCSAVADQKKRSFSTMASFFFYHRKWFSEICRADFYHFDIF